MQYLLQIFMPADAGAWDELSEAQQEAITSEYFALRNDPGFISGAQLHPADTATTVRVENGRTLLDLRTVFPEEEPELKLALDRCLPRY